MAIEKVGHGEPRSFLWCDPALPGLVARDVVLQVIEHRLSDAFKVLNAGHAVEEDDEVDVCRSPYGSSFPQRSALKSVRSSINTRVISWGQGMKRRKVCKVQHIRYWLPERPVHED